MKSCKTSPRSTRTALKAAEVVRLRCEEHTFDEIAKRLDLVDRSHARKLYSAGMANAFPRESAERLRRLESLKLRRLWKALYPFAIGQKSKGVPDPCFIDRLLKISAQVAALHGLSQPKTLVQNSSVTNYCRMVVRTTDATPPSLPAPTVIDGTLTALPPALPAPNGSGNDVFQIRTDPNRDSEVSANKDGTPAQANSMQVSGEPRASIPDDAEDGLIGLA
jgi:hypothetical protein